MPGSGHSDRPKVIVSGDRCRGGCCDFPGMAHLGTFTLKRGSEMPLYLFVTGLLLTLFLGFIGGLWVFRRSLMWCDRCGETLTCAKCLSRGGVITSARSR